MKTSGALLLIGLGVIGTVSFTEAQSKSDPSYSEHNYKHPNKAQEIKKQKGSSPEVYLQEIKSESNENQHENSLVAEENYKCISVEKSKTREFRSSNSNTAKPFQLETTVNNNYHQRFPSTKKQAAKSSKEKSSKPPSWVEAKKQ